MNAELCVRTLVIWVRKYTLHVSLITSLSSALLLYLVGSTSHVINGVLAVSLGVLVLSSMREPLARVYRTLRLVGAGGSVFNVSVLLNTLVPMTPVLVYVVVGLTDTWYILVSLLVLVYINRRIITSIRHS